MGKCGKRIYLAVSASGDDDSVVEGDQTAFAVVFTATDGRLVGLAGISIPFNGSMREEGHTE